MHFGLLLLLSTWLAEADDNPIDEPQTTSVSLSISRTAPERPVQAAQPDRTALDTAPRQVAKAAASLPAKPEPQPERQTKQATKPKLATKPLKPKRLPQESALQPVAKSAAQPETASARHESPALVLDAMPRQQRKSIEVDYLRRLQAAIGRHKRYPRLSRRRNEEGRVMLSLLITAEGRFRDIQVDQSSGYQRLDQAAIKTLHRIQNFEPLPTELGRLDWLIRVPLVFRLGD